MVTQSYSAFNHVLSDLSLIVNRFESLSLFSTCTNRLAFLVDALEACRLHAATDKAIQRVSLAVPGPQDTSLPRRHRTAVVRAEQLTLRTPDGARTLTKDLSFELIEGEALLVTGSSGAGKTSLCRAVAGLPLWASGSGSLAVAPRWRVANGGGHLQCLPQQPYMLPRGATLRAQLSYLCGGTPPSDAEITAALGAVGLQAMAENLDMEGADWARTLSPGEQQRVAFARLLLGPPAALVVLDEATSALDEAAERRCYAALRAQGPALLSVGHRAALRAVHDRELQLLPGGRWALQPLQPLQPLAAAAGARGHGRDATAAVQSEQVEPAPA